MPGKPINGNQVKLYKEARDNGKTQRTAAAIAGISERTGRRIEKGEYKIPQKKERYWRTHPDDFHDVWTNEIVPLLVENPQQNASTLFRNLQEKHPGKYSERKLRTFQRRVRIWKQTNRQQLLNKKSTYR